MESNQIKVELQEVMGNDRSIASAAWTSSMELEKKEMRSDEDVTRVVKMLAEAKHSTPFESVVMRFWIKMPIAIDRQYMTHRIQSANGMSGRYRTMPREFLSVSEDVVDITTKGIVGLYGDTLSAQSVINDYTNTCTKVNALYIDIVNDFRKAEKAGHITNNEFKRAREFYRGMLPQHNFTERVSVMNLRSFSNFQKLRNSEHAQPEIQQVAKLMLAQVKEKNVAPIALEWLEKNGWTI